MRFKLDENLPRAAQDLLTSHGHDAETVLGKKLGGATDDRVEHRCREEARVLITLDLDFADIRRFPPSDGPGILILRPPRLNTQEILKLLKGMLQLLPDESPEGRLWIVESGRIRVRG